MSGRRLSLWPPLAAALFAGWGCGGPSLLATVEVPAALKSTCIRVVAVADGAEIASQLVRRPEGADPLLVAIFEPQGQSRGVTAIARGYVGQGCDEPLLLNEESAPVAAGFRPGGGPVALTLLPPPPALDGDGDGYRAASAGGPDCGDRLASVHPGAVESCGDLADNDCDGKVDCAQPSCLSQPCGGGRTCTQQGSCQGLETACANGSDDDLDGLADCLDPDCAGTSCDDGSPCTTQDMCQAGQCEGSPVVCNSPPASECLGSTGTCNPADGGCRYPSLSGQTCSAGACDHDGVCGPLYSYAPANFTPPDAGAFVPLRFDCGRANLDTTPGAGAPFSGQLCGQASFPALIDRPQAGAGNAVIVPVEQLTVAPGSDLVVSGPRPVIFAVFGDALIDGRIWFAVGQGAIGNGAGTTTAQCASGQGLNGGNAGTSAAGGGGGSYGTAGARGGNGSGSTGGAAGTAFGSPVLVPLFGGCAGGSGGNNGGNTGGGPGGGGGAIQISATGSVTIRGAVSAPGGGGGGGRNHQTGGGGGGSGGSVLLEGRSVRVSPTGVVSTSGGGGGAGDSCCASGFADGSGGGSGSVDSLGTANGGTSQAGGNGGRGAAGTQAASQGGNGGPLSLPGTTYQGGGGGGGAGLGRIRINATGNCQLDGGFSGVLTGNQGGTNGCP